MMNRILAGVLSLMMLATPGVSFAADEEIKIGEITLNSCGETTAEISFTVDVVEKGVLDVIEVFVDGTSVFASDEVEDGDVLEFGPLLVSTNERTIEAYVYDNDPEDIVASDSTRFDIDCLRNPQLLVGDAIDQVPDRQDSDGDCCPGPGGDSGAHDDEGENSATVTSSKKATVKGVKTHKTSSLAPLNSIFRSVFGRTPTFEEWTYWANRMLSDKPELDELFGAMQWHKLQGRTVGK